MCNLKLKTVIQKSASFEATLFYKYFYRMHIKKIYIDLKQLNT